MLSISGRPKRLCDGLNRRELLTIGALGFGGLALPDLLRAEANRAWADREIGHHDLLVRRSAAPGYVRSQDAGAGGNPRRISADRDAVPGIEICEHLPRLAKIMDKLVPIRSVYGSPDGNHDSFICYTGRSVQQSAARRLALGRLDAIEAARPGQRRRFLRSSVCRPMPGIRLTARRGIPAFLGALHTAVPSQRRGSKRFDTQRHHRRSAGRPQAIALAALTACDAISTPAARWAHSTPSPSRHSACSLRASWPTPSTFPKKTRASASATAKATNAIMATARRATRSIFSSLAGWSKRVPAA